jgi:hypothetical protein
MSKAEIEEKSMTSSQTDFKKKSVEEIAQSPPIKGKPSMGRYLSFLIRYSTGVNHYFHQPKADLDLW